MATPPPAAEQPKIKLYWLEQSRAQRILWLLEELKLPYELETFKRDAKTHLAPPALQKVHPLGKSPTITILPPGATDPVVISESGFIVEYLLEYFGNGSTLLPKRYMEGQEGKIGGETEEWKRFRYFMHYAEGNLMQVNMMFLLTNSKFLFPILNGSNNVATAIKSAPVPWLMKPVTRLIGDKIISDFLQPTFLVHWNFIEGQLKTSGGDYLCGKYLTGADILMSFVLIAAKESKAFTKDKCPMLAAYVDMLEKEPGYGASVAKIVKIEGKFEAMLPM
ncbi:Glutathione S-transferase [Lachnellula suecica]|uniref:glutathione transferase n=1 Tax=Lachnellula suecica TaxID=602035 RepID=A0A8T9CDL6_9HELO|nr:Glutathione S-transferase [Lachnellula suecica]